MKRNVIVANGRAQRARVAATAALVVAWLATASGAAGSEPAGAIAPAGYAEFVVSPQRTAGERAFTSIADALAAAGRLRAQQPAAPIRIVVEDGAYFVPEPLRVGPALSGTAAAPTEIVAAAGAAPRLQGGRMLGALSWTPLRGGIYSAHVTGPAFDRLFVDGELQVRARYPNRDPGVAVFEGYAADALAPARTARWANPAGGIVHALHEARWGDMKIPVLGRNGDGTLRLGEALGNNRPSPPHAVYRYVDNIFEELDAPGEWYLDTSLSVLYYRPKDGVDVNTMRVDAGGPARLFSLEGGAGMPLRHVTIRGLSLSRTATSYLPATEPLLRSDWMIAREGAIFLENTENVRILDNSLQDLGGNAIFASGHQRALTIRGNLMRAIGGSGVSFVGRPEAVRSPAFRYEQFVDVAALDMTPGPKADAYPSDSSVEDNLIHDIGTVEKQVAGVQLSMAMNIHVAHNTIYDVPRAGINISEGTWGGHVIEYNDVFNTVLETGDHGAFNSWGRDRFWHPDRAVMDQINARHKDLWKLDVLAPITLRYNRFHCDHGWDIDLDDGSSSYRIYDNVMLAGGLKLREGFDRVATNNIILNNGFHPHVWFAGSGDRFERNIVMAAHQPILMRHWDGVVDRNLFPTNKALKQAQELGLDQHSSAGAPNFVDPAHGDFRVAQDSPAIALGFRNFPMDQFGVVSERLRRLQDKHAPVPQLIVADGRADTTYLLLGARIKTVTTLGEQSAAGLTEPRGVLVLAVEPGSLAAASGLQVGDVITDAAATDYSPAERIEDAPELQALYGARRWRGSQELIVVRNQRPQAVRLRFTEE